MLKLIALTSILFFLSTQVFAGNQTLYYSKDTIPAGNLFKVAKSFDDKAKYDSALYYYDQSAKAFKKAKCWEKFIKCRNNIITIKRRAGIHENLIGEASKNLGFSLKKLGEMSDRTADCYNIMGNVYEDSYATDTALYFFRKALLLYNVTTENNDTRRAYAHRNIGITYSSKGLYDSARHHINKSVELLREIYDDGHPELAGCYNSLGIIAYHLGKYEECRNYFGKVVTIREKSVGLSHPLTAEAYNNNAALFMAMALYDTALIMHEKAYEIRLRALPEKHPHIALSLNNIGNVYMLKGMYDTSLDYHLKALQCRLEIFDTLHTNVAMSFTNLGKLYRIMGRYETAIHYFEQSLKIQRKLLDDDNPYLADAFNNVGTGYSDLCDYDRCLQYFNTALELRLRKGEYTPKVANSYNNIGAIYKYKGDFDLALAYYRKSVDIGKVIHGGNHPDLSGTYNNIGEVYIIKNQYDTALYYFNMAMKMDSAFFGEGNPELASSYLNRGTVYGHLKMLEEEYHDYRKGLRISEDNYGEAHSLNASFYSNIAANFNERNMPDSAIAYGKRALEIVSSAFPVPHPRVSAMLRDMGEYYENTGLFDTAQLFYYKSLQANYFQTFEKDKIDVTFIFKENEFATTLLYLCRLKYKWYNITNDEQHLKDIICFFGHIPSLTQSVISDFLLEETKINLLNQLSKYTIYAVDASALLYQITGEYEYYAKSLEFSEVNKSPLLQARYFANNEPGTPSEILWKRNSLVSSIEYLQMKMHENILGHDFSAKTKIQQAIDSMMLCLQVINDTIKLCTSQSFAPLAFSGNELLNRISDCLVADDAFISYFVSDSALITYLITADTIMLFREIFDHSGEIKSFADGYLSALKKYDKEKVKIYNQHLYDILIKNIAGYCTDKKNLVIIPDKYLFLIPFETLCSEIDTVESFADFSRQDYLIKKYGIKYHYSAGLWTAVKPERNDAGSGLIAFAPVFQDENRVDAIQDNISMKENDIARISYRDTLFPALPYSLTEIDSITRICSDHYIDTKVYTFKNATKSNLKQNLSYYKYIHIATHGFSDVQQASNFGLIFAFGNEQKAKDGFLNSEYDHILYAHELYPLTINAHLVVLSACETGAGKIEEGEGLISLARGFLSAGAENVLFSYWKVGDKNTLNVMTGFYRNIFDSQDACQALRKAKLEMIGKPETSYPLTWGGFSLIGR
ncbi:MAG: CHAT domain-containing tetratricopeptide repeat protein [Bacteroidales bacterium]